MARWMEEEGIQIKRPESSILGTAHSHASHTYSQYNRNESIYVTCAKKHEKNDDNDKNNITHSIVHARIHAFGRSLDVIKRSP